MGILDVLVDELNKNDKNKGEWKRLHSEPYQIVQTAKGVFHNPIKRTTPPMKEEDETMEITVFYPWKMDARFIDDFETTVGGFSEADCIDQIATLTEKHGECVWYSGYSDENYYDGQYIGE